MMRQDSKSFTPPSQRKYLRLLIIFFCLVIFGTLLHSSYNTTNMALSSLVPYTSSGKSDVSQSLKDAVTSSREKKNAITSLLVSGNYVRALEVLGFSIGKVKTSAEMIVAYTEGAASPQDLCRLKAVGWTPRLVEKISPPKKSNGDTPYDRFFYMFTKLHFWNWLEYNTILYLDADTLAYTNFDELFDLPINFATVQDVWDNRIDDKFNAGVMLIKPNGAVYNDLILRMQTDVERYDVRMAEQAFLGLYYAVNSYRLPHKYNLNLALAHHADMWKEVYPQTAIVHMTLEKPFFKKERTGDAKFQSVMDKWWASSDQLDATKILAHCSPDST